ncbi:MAG: hypothetical protein J3K34DRAFT_410910 [Monoraphidium minutum]|nr:MAG: hypothetical protein J3K34DRAFT_410910 [Monoraphidium minutum]
MVVAARLVEAVGTGDDRGEERGRRALEAAVVDPRKHLLAGLDALDFDVAAARDAVFLRARLGQPPVLDAGREPRERAGFALAVREGAEHADGGGTFDARANALHPDGRGAERGGRGAVQRAGARAPRRGAGPARNADAVSGGRGLGCVRHGLHDDRGARLEPGPGAAGHGLGRGAHHAGTQRQLRQRAGERERRAAGGRGEALGGPLGVGAGGGAVGDGEGVLDVAPKVSRQRRAVGGDLERNLGGVDRERGVAAARRRALCRGDCDVRDPPAGRGALKGGLLAGGGHGGGGRARERVADRQRGWRRAAGDACEAGEAPVAGVGDDHVAGVGARCGFGEEAGGRKSRGRRSASA